MYINQTFDISKVTSALKTHFGTEKTYCFLKKKMSMFQDEKNFTTENFINAMCQMKTQQKFYDRVTDTAIYSLKNCFPSDEFLLHFQEMNKSRQIDGKALTKQLIDVILARKKLKRDVNDKNKLRDLDISYFKNCIYNIEKEITALKNQTNLELERLSSEEAELTISVQRLLSKKELFFDTDEKKLPKKPISTKDASMCNSKEVTSFMNFLHSHGGHEGGWGVDDHHIFVKYYKMNHKDITQLIKTLANYLPEYTDEDIIEHVEWYIAYETKKEKYKNAIQEWKQKRNQPRKNSTEQVIEIKKRVPEDTKASIKEKINEWKEKKLKQLEKEKEELLQKQALKFRSRTNIDRRHQIKSKIRDWKQQRETEKQQLLEQQRKIERMQQEIRVNEAKRLIKEFQSQDKEFLQRRSQLRKSTKNALRSRSLSLVTVDRDRERAMADTKQSLARIQRPSTEEIKIVNSLQSSIHVNNIPKLKRPEWIGSLPYI